MRLKAVTTCAGLLAGVLVGLSPSAAHAAPTRYEAETSPAVCTGTIDSNHAGFSGSGFCNGTNAAGAHAQFTVNASAAGTATLAVRFASGTSSSRPADLTVNGTTVQSVSFEGTGAWNTWVTKTMTVSVNSGSNTIRFNPTSSAGLPNIDYIDVEAGGTTQPPGDTLYVAPGGRDSAAGTQADPTTLTSAITRIAAGGTIYMRGGRYD
ncbi:carbohydrate-binding protein, partial [Nonomuraea sp. KM90]|uniref:carbohydrate-binding protein n=1 Tax=Nonomuraea sp. KM90 TaxID=3457428 RepID=UPI003FCC3ED6